MDDFREWFDKKWKQHNGVITSITASNLLHLSLARINTLRKGKKIREFQFKKDKTLYLSYKDVLSLADFYKAKREMQRRFNRRVEE